MGASGVELQDMISKILLVAVYFIVTRSNRIDYPCTVKASKTFCAPFDQAFGYPDGLLQSFMFRQGAIWYSHYAFSSVHGQTPSLVVWWWCGLVENVTHLMRSNDSMNL